MTNKEALTYLAKQLGLANYPNGTEEDLTKDQYAFTCLYQLDAELRELEQFRHIFNSPIQTIMKELRELEQIKDIYKVWLEGEVSDFITMRKIFDVFGVEEKND